MTMHGDLEEPLDPLEREAMRWVVLLTRPNATPTDAHMAALWRAQDPAHEAAFQEVAGFCRIAREMGVARPLADVVALKERSARAGPSRRMALFGGGALAAGAAGWMTVQPPLGLWPSLAELTADHHTGVGERRSFAVGEDVDVELNGRSAVSIRDQGRGLSLIEGEAFIKVRDVAAGPLLVQAGDNILTLRSGSVNLRTSARETYATCLDGTVVARGPAGPVTLSAGQALALRPGAQAAVTTVDPSIADAWRRGLLIFQDTPLADAVEAIDRYRNGRIILATEALGNLRVYGVFHTNRLHRIVAQLQGLLHVRVARLPGGVTILA